MQTPAREVLAQVARDLKSRGLTHEDIARDLDYKTRQTVGTILSSKRYMTPAQARRFSDRYGYYFDFLVSGAGSLTGPTADETTAYYVPEHALILQPIDSIEKFRKSFNGFLESMFAAYGEEAVHGFLSTAARYVWTYCNAGDAHRDRHRKPGTFVKEENGKPGEYDTYADQIRDTLITSLYDLYSQCVKRSYNPTEQK